MRIEPIAHRRIGLLALATAGATLGLACSAAPSPAPPEPHAARPAVSVSPSAAVSAAPAPSSAKPGRGLLSVHTDPPGAMVIIEGGVMAETPIDRVDIAAGKHQMIIAMPGYEAVGTTLDIVAGEHTVQEIILSRGGAAPSGGAPGCSASLCQRDCFQDHAHCESDCGFCSDCSSPVDGSGVQCSVCLACKETCRQMQRACERGCQACE